MTSEQRQAAIEKKRAELLPVSIDSIFAMHGVAFSVLPPAITEDVTSEMSDKIGSKMILIAAQNGIGGLCTNPVLALVAKVESRERSVTGTAPQKAVVKYDVTFYAGNFITNDIYASCAQHIMGVGSNFIEAGNNAANEIMNDADIQKMLSDASQRAIAWYSNTENVSTLVDRFVSEQNYPLAMALLSSVPEVADKTFAYASKKNKEVSDMFFEEKAAELLGAMQGAVAAGGDEYNPEVGAYLKLIPVRSGSYKAAQELYDNYIARIREVSDTENARAYQKELMELDLAHREEMERLAVEKIKAPYEAQVSIAQIKADSQVATAQARNTGGFLGLGKFWDHSFGLANRLLGAAGI